MLTLSATCLAIACAIDSGALQVTECEGRFGPYWAIEDDHGLIEVALSEEEAAERISGMKGRITDSVAPEVYEAGDLPW